MQKLTNTQFTRKCKDAFPTIKPLEKYKGGKVKIKFHCTECESDFMRTPRLMFKRPRCPATCARMQTVIKTQNAKNAEGLAKLRAWLKTTPYKLVKGTFVSNSRPATFRCTVDGNEWTTWPKSTMKLVHGCNVCALKAAAVLNIGRVWNDTKKQLAARKIKVLERPTTANGTVKYVCPEHTCEISFPHNRLRHELERLPDRTPNCFTCSEKNRSHCTYKRKPYKRGTDDYISLMGYERLAIRWLRRERNVAKNEIRVSSDAEFSRIPYVDHTGKSRQYTADFFLPLAQMYIEVKSTLTAGLQEGTADDQVIMGKTQEWLFELLKAKRRGVLQAGFKFTLLLMKPDGTRMTLPKGWYNMSRAKLLDRLY